MKIYYLIKICLFILITYYSPQILAQEYFQGSIEYEISFEIHDPNIAVEQLKQDFGVGSIFYYKDGKYIQIYNNSASIEFDFLDSNSKKYYVKYPNNDTLYVQDATVNNDETVINTQMSNSNKKVLDYNCERLDISIQNNVYGMEYQLSFLFSKKIEINNEHFVGIKKAFVETVYGSINSIPLEIRMISPMFTLISTAVYINEEKNISLENMFKERTTGLIIKDI